MKRLVFFTILLLSASMLQAQDLATLEGKINEKNTNSSLIAATIVLEELNKGATTDLNGSFKIVDIPAGSYTLKVSSVGFETISQKIEFKAGENKTLNFSLEEETTLIEELVISGTRKAEKLTETPATIEVIGFEQIDELPALNPGELLARQKGVDFFRAGVVGTGINVRGFNSNFNAKNLQVTDGRFSSLIATGLPLGPLNTVIKEDIEQVELVLGPNAALFGPNAHNGLMNTITKDPRKYEGTTIAFNAGNQKMFSSRLRHAEKVNEKFAYKVTAEYSRGEEFEYIDSVYLSPTNPVEELDLNRDFEFFRGEASMIYSPVEDMDITFNYGGSNSTYLAPTNVGRNQIKDWQVHYAQAKFSYKGLFAQVYHTISKTDATYSISDYTKQYYGAIGRGLSEQDARAFALDPAVGALFIDDSKRWNAELQYNRDILGVDVTVGAQWQRDMANSHGTYLLDENEDDFITIDQVGAYAQAEKKFDNGLKLVGALRADNHQVYGFNLLPKAAVVKTFGANSVRLTYGQGIAAPTILNMYGNLFGGLILGNAEGFTLEDGSMIEKQRVEKLQTIELGYKGQPVKNKLFVDANVYYNISRDFLSPVTSIGVANKMGDQNVADVQSAYAAFNGLVFTYINFGEFNTHGADLGINYYFTDEFSTSFNYSYFGYEIDESNLENDFNKDGTVNKLDLLVNAPNHKASLALNYSGKKFFGSIFTRWVEAYDYFSSYQIAAETQDLTYRGVPVVEGARSANAFNYGPLGGFTTFDISAGYRFNETFTASAMVSNVFDTEMREFTAAPPTGRLISLELKINLPSYKK
ncbi:TonB-dependent receptor [Sediminitomix flava]|uniref:Iron complex outermembrane receptor protein n=1 Tax=Sediminitomix flava TaxID=379075 RepID=A0A315ZGM1_SEDFL|nr:TonB-dependent receptor [Sediminitomix flava]PWJ44736.1 iron complex outermembrane receptor protein [Sediminitomix flava]